MKIGEKIDVNKLKNGRPWNARELYDAIKLSQIVWSWGAKNWTIMNEFALKFSVNGHHHKGHVYLAVNASDLFDVYLTTNRGTIKKILNDLFVEDLINQIDEAVEKIDAYQS
jgi:hypothetical protein